MSDRSPDQNGGKETSDRTGEHWNVTVTNGGVPRLDELLECLTKSRRRLVLYYLQENDVADVEELATEIAAWEMDVLPDDVPIDHREDITRELLHNHLPRLAETKCIEYDRRSGTVRYTELPTLLDRILRLLSKLEGKSNS